MITDLGILAGEVLAAQTAKSDAEAALKAASAQYDKARDALFAAMTDAELSKVSANGHTFALDMKTYYSVPAESMDAFAAVMTERGLGDIFKRTVHYQTLNATLREIARSTGGELPGDLDPLVRSYDEGRLAVRKERSRK